MIINQLALRGIFVGFNTIFNRVFNEQTPLWSKIATRVPSSTSEENYKWLGKIPRMREWIGEREIQNISASDYTIKNKKFELTIAVPRDEIEDDRIGVYNPVISDIAQSTALHPDNLVFKLLKEGFKTECYDKKPFFSKNHKIGKKEISNMNDEKLTAESYGKARMAMMSLTDEDGNSLNIMPDTLVVPPALEGAAKKILESDYIEGSSNIWKGTAELLVVPELAGKDSDSAWYLLCTKKSLKPIIFQEREVPKFTSRTNENDENVFNNDEYQYGVRARSNAGYGFWQMAFGSTGKGEVEETSNKAQTQSDNAQQHSEDPGTTDYESMTVEQLKVIAQEKGITGYSSMNKSDLIAAIQATEGQA